MISQDIVTIGAIMLILTIIVLAALGKFNKLIEVLGRHREGETAQAGIKLNLTESTSDFITNSKNVEIFGDSLERCLAAYVDLKKIEKENKK